MTSNPEDSSFVRAIGLAEGRVLSVIDEEGKTYTRAWCILEIFFGLAGKYEMYTAKEGCVAYDHTRYDGRRVNNVQGLLDYLGKDIDRTAVGLTDGPCGEWNNVSAGVDFDNASFQTLRQASFPIELVQYAFKVKIQDSEASDKADHKRILNYIVGRRETDLELPTLEEDSKYDETNAKLHGLFAAAGWRLLLDGEQDMQEAASMLYSSSLFRFGLSVAGCKAFNDEEALRLVSALPLSIQELRLTAPDCSATAAGLRRMLDAVGERLQLQQLQVLSFIDCSLPGSVPVWLGNCRKLRELILDHNSLSGDIPDALGECTALEMLFLHFNQLQGAIPKSLGNCIALKSVRLHNNKLTGVIPSTLGHLLCLETLRLEDNDLGGAIPSTLGQCGALQELILSGNDQLGSTIPEELGACKVLKSIFLYNRNITQWQASEIPQPLRVRKDAGLLQGPEKPWTG